MTTTIPDVGFASRAEAHTSPQPRLLAKRSFDVVVAAAAIVVLSPVFLLIAIAMLISERGPVLFRQERVGRHGAPFTMWKFRTMVVDAEAHLLRLRAENQRSGPLFKMTADPRVTRIGQLLRATSLDELPQLFNVLQGTMSLVGPRPALYEERASFTPDLLRREQMPPGITGLWQVEARTDGDFDRYRELDLRYVREWSFWLDLQLLVRTPVMLVRHALTPTIESPPAELGSERESEAPTIELDPTPAPRPDWLLPVLDLDHPAPRRHDQAARSIVDRPVSISS